MRKSGILNIGVGEISCIDFDRSRGMSRYVAALNVLDKAWIFMADECISVFVLYRHTQSNSYLTPRARPMLSWNNADASLSFSGPTKSTPPLLKNVIKNAHTESGTAGAPRCQNRRSTMLGRAQDKCLELSEVACQDVQPFNRDQARARHGSSPQMMNQSRTAQERAHWRVARMRCTKTDAFLFRVFLSINVLTLEVIECRDAVQGCW